MWSVSVLIAACLVLVVQAGPRTKRAVCQPRQWGDITRGSYWYRCSGSNEQVELAVQMGCLDQRRAKLTIGQTYVHNRYVMRCQIGTDSKLEIVQAGCDVNGTTYTQGKTWDEGGKFWYTCFKNLTTDVIFIQVSGCIKNGTRLSIGDTIVANNQKWQCQRATNGAVSMCSVGCMVNGRMVDAGEEFIAGDFRYQCTNKNRGCYPTAIACLDNNNRDVVNYQTFRKGNTMYQCEIAEGNGTLKFYGCYDSANNRERRDGETWTVYYDQNKRLGYTWTCNKAESGNVAVLAQESCIYLDSYNNEATLDGGCVMYGSNYQNPMTYACRIQAGGNLEFFSIKPAASDYYQRIQGLVSCYNGRRSP